jgi:hypothetical protein
MQIRKGRYKSQGFSHLVRVDALIDIVDDSMDSESSENNS